MIYFEDGTTHGWASESTKRRELGSSEFAKTAIGAFWGTPPPIDLGEELALNTCLRAIAASGVATSISDVSDGGVAITLARASIARGIGCTVAVGGLYDLFTEFGSTAVVTCAKEDVAKLESVMAKERTCMIADQIGETGGDRLTLTSHPGRFSKVVETILDVPLSELSDLYSTSLESALAEEVLA
jgi:phosphoribosylformylglycinamidine synthase